MHPQHPHPIVDLPTPSSSAQLIPSSSSPEKKDHDPPVSPTAIYQHMIMSDTLDTKSPEELRSLVQEAYTTLRAKEKGMLHTSYMDTKTKSHDCRYQVGSRSGMGFA